MKFKCPDCGAKMTRREHYDADEDCFECEECEGIFFSEDELIPASVKKHADKRRTQISNGKPTKKVQAKAKAVKKKPSEPKEVRARDAVPVNDVITIMADELLEIYAEVNQPLDLPNAREKATILLRGMKYTAKGTFHDKPVDHVLCKEHS